VKHCLPALFVLLLAAGLGASWAVGSIMVRTRPSAVAPARPPAEDLRLTAADGIGIAATYRPGRGPDAPAVLLLHGNDSSRAANAANAAWLARWGFATLAIDFRGHGGSGTAPHSFGLFEARDARAGFAWLKRHQHGAPVAVVGASLGGAASLLGEDGPLPADALVLQAVYPDLRHAIRNRIASIVTIGPALLLEPLLSFQALPRMGVWPSRLAPIDALAHYHGPVLVIGGAADRYTPPEETRTLYAAAVGPKALWFAPGADHAATCVLETMAYRARLLAFLRATIGRRELARSRQIG
jgi:pimeloyl-ACP methyl ester carboxylesterase